jgi:hypothetical protein
MRAAIGIRKKMADARILGDDIIGRDQAGSPGFGRSFTLPELPLYRPARLLIFRTIHGRRLTKLLVTHRGEGAYLDHLPL